MNKQNLDEMKTIVKSIFDKKGCNIIAIDVEGASSVADCFIVAEGSVDRHVQALSNEVVHSMKKRWNLNPFHVERDSGSNWIVLDYGSIVVHLLTREFRDLYRIESVWKNGKIVDLDLQAIEAGEDR